MAAEDMEKKDPQDTAQNPSESAQDKEPQKTAEREAQNGTPADGTASEADAADEKETAAKAEGGQPEAEEKSDASEETDAADTQEEAAEEPKKNGKSEGFFKRKNKKDKKDEQIEELTDRVKRQMAEFENFRRRSEKEKSQMYEIGARSIIEKILPVVDNFERGLSGIEEGNDDPFAAGMQMIYKQLITSLSEAGVTPIEAVGKEFDPNFHNAVMHVEDEELGENVVAEEFQKGYLYKDTVIRHSMVKVAN